MMQTSSHRATRRPACPRCGYDFEGTVAAWTETCPLAGRCNECGFEFDWRDVHTLAVHPWLFEYHWRRGPLKRLIVTIATGFRPVRFWRQVRVTDPVYLVPAALVAAFVGITAILATVGHLTMQRRWLIRNRPWDEVLALSWERFIGLPARAWRDAPGLIIVILAIPILFAVLPVTRRRARVRWRHLIRIWLYSLIGPAIVTTIWTCVFIICEWRGWPTHMLDPWRWRYSAALRTANDGPLLLARYHLPGFLLMMLAYLWVVRWWFVAMRDYLRLDHARVIMLLLGIAILAAGLAAEFFDGFGVRYR